MCVLICNSSMVGIGQEYSQESGGEDFQNSSLVNGVRVVGALDVKVCLSLETDNQLG